MNDYSSWLRNLDDEKYFLFIVSVQDKEGEDVESLWEGKMNAMKNFNKKNFEQLESRFNSSIQRLQT